MRRYPSQIVGLRFVGHDGVPCHESAAALTAGDPIDLQPEPDNPFDPRAVACYAAGRHLGYVPAKHTFIAEQLNDNRPIRASVDTVHRDAAGHVRNVDLHVDVARRGQDFGGAFGREPGRPGARAA